MEIRILHRIKEGKSSKKPETTKGLIVQLKNEWRK